MQPYRAQMFFVDAPDGPFDLLVNWQAGAPAHFVSRLFNRAYGADLSGLHDRRRNHVLDVQGKDDIIPRNGAIGSVTVSHTAHKHAR